MARFSQSIHFFSQFILFDFWTIRLPQCIQKENNVLKQRYSSNGQELQKKMPVGRMSRFHPWRQWYSRRGGMINALWMDWRRWVIDLGKPSLCWLLWMNSRSHEMFWTSSNRVQWQLKNSSMIFIYCSLLLIS